MDIEEVKEGEVTVLGPVGSLNSQTSPAFEQRFTALLIAGARRIVVDLRSVDIVTSAALRVLLVAGRRLGPGVGRLVLCSLKEEVRKVFAISGFDRDFTIVAARGEAVAKAAEAIEAKVPTPAREKPAAPAPPAPPAPPPLASLAAGILVKGDADPPPWTRWESGTDDKALRPLRARVIDILSRGPGA